MNCKIIATGSSGNAVILNGNILIDCGVSFRSLRPYIRQLDIVLLTHIHSDHFQAPTVRRLADARPALRFACCEWLAPECLLCGITQLDMLRIGKTYDYGAFQVSPVRLYHDVPNCGWRVFRGGEKAIYCTDTATLDGISARGYDLYLIEANYTEDDIAERIRRKQQTGQYIYEYRARQTHLSKEQCDSWLLENMGNQSRYIYLHQHKEEQNAE